MHIDYIIKVYVNGELKDEFRFKFEYEARKKYNELSGVWLWANPRRSGSVHISRMNTAWECITEIRINQY